ncbi:MAG: hypothetical protein K2L10_01280 [Ruminococcus sp.]|nr:hypothetical protein [Ruminococcus sp.]
MKKEKKYMFNVLAKPVDTAIILDGKKAEDFFSQKPDPKVKERILRNAAKMKLQRIKNEEKEKEKD